MVVGHPLPIDLSSPAAPRPPRQVLSPAASRRRLLGVDARSAAETRDPWWAAITRRPGWAGRTPVALGAAVARWTFRARNAVGPCASRPPSAADAIGVPDCRVHAQSRTRPAGPCGEMPFGPTLPLCRIGFVKGGSAWVVSGVSSKLSRQYSRTGRCTLNSNCGCTSGSTVTCPGCPAIPLSPGNPLGPGLPAGPSGPCAARRHRVNDTTVGTNEGTVKVGQARYLPAARANRPADPRWTGGTSIALWALPVARARLQGAVSGGNSREWSDTFIPGAPVEPSLPDFPVETVNNPAGYLVRMFGKRKGYSDRASQHFLAFRLVLCRLDIHCA